MANADTLTDHLNHIVTGATKFCCEQEILAGVGIVLGLIAVSAICAPFLNPAPRGD